MPTSGVAQLTALNQWGALRGLETFSQLVNWAPNGTANSYSLPGTPIAINDYPRMQWRSACVRTPLSVHLDAAPQPLTGDGAGVLIDSSRHFLTVSAIKVTLDAMSYNKMNRLVQYTAPRPSIEIAENLCDVRSIGTSLTITPGHWSEPLRRRLIIPLTLFTSCAVFASVPFVYQGRI